MSSLQSVDPAFQAPLSPILPKKKLTAVLIAVFYSFWAWIYTYKVDSWKFWLSLVLSFFTAGLWWIFVAWPWAIIDAARRPDDWYATFPNGDILQRQAGIQQAAAVQASFQQIAAPSAEPTAGEPGEQPPQA